jgi:hypothetical protein
MQSCGGESEAFQAGRINAYGGYPMFASSYNSLLGRSKSAEHLIETLSQENVLNDAT